MADGITGIIPGVMGLALVGESMKMLPKEMRDSPKVSKINMHPKSPPIGFHDLPKANNSMKKQTGSMVKGFTNITMGTALLGGVAGMVK